jgi:hypothetical protein
MTPSKPRDLVMKGPIVAGGGLKPARKADVMSWDDELPRLRGQVLDIFGGDVLEAFLEMDAATRRALAVVKQQPIDWEAMSVFYDALKAELRLLVEPR